MQNQIKFFFVLTAIFLSLFTINGLGITVTYSDILMLVLVPVFIKDLIKENLHKHPYGNNLFLYTLILLVSGCLNLTLLDGPYLNVFKTSLFSWIIFCYSYTLFIKAKQKQLRNYFIGLIVFCFLFILKTWQEIQTKWADVDEGFTNVDVFKSSLNLNSWGFIMLLFFILFAFLLNIRFLKPMVLPFVIITFALVLYSLSRTAWLLLLLSSIVIIFAINKASLKSLLGIACIILMGSFLYFEFNLFQNIIPESALDFFSAKTETADSDFVNTRVMLINVIPILNYYNEFNFFNILFGDGLSIQHSWISHTLIVTGLIGFIVYTRKYIIALQEARNKRVRNHIPASYLILLIVLVLVNDFVTNISQFLPISAYLSTLMFALFFSYLNRNNYEKKY